MTPHHCTNSEELIKENTLIAVKDITSYLYLNTYHQLSHSDCSQALETTNFVESTYSEFSFSYSGVLISNFNQKKKLFRPNYKKS